MKKVRKGAEPPRLDAYRQLRPTNTWEQCTKNKNRRDEIQQQLRGDQGGICAYCEVNLLPAVSSNEVADFRVEHFHPKSDVSTVHNWHLDWNNLLACCHGGSQRGVVDAASRFTSPDNSCDVPKGDNDWDAIILNPLHLPAFPCLFRYTRSDGSMQADSAACLQASVDPLCAQETVSRLHLDAARLRRLRRLALDNLNQQLQALVNKGVPLEEARRRLARAHLSLSVNGEWPAFFSAIRNYLGQEAETHLQAIHFDG